MSVLEAQKIAVARGGRPILDGVTLALQPGEMLAIVGPNGCGKSTLLRALAGIWPVAQGSVLLDGNAIGGYSRREIARRVALLPQSTRTDLAFTVEELVAMGRYPHRGRFAAEGAADRRAIQAAMECCDVAGLRDRFVNTLSGGEQQRVLIARSLAVEPACILLDEPTSSLDVAHYIEVLELCRTLTNAGRSVALATHDINAVSRYASTVALIQAGRLVHYGPRDQILQPSVLEQVFGVRAEMLAAAGGEPVYVFHPTIQPRRPVT